MDKKSTFGDLLQHHRKLTKDTIQNQRPLSQGRLAEELKKRAGFTFTYGTISGWERNTISISQDSRALLLAILKVLLSYGGLNQLDEANHLLRSGGHVPLNDTEVADIYPHWQRKRPITYSMKVASHEIQRAALPQQLELQGKDEVINLLNAQLVQESNPQVLFLTGRGGVGKSAVATALAHTYLNSTPFIGVAWIPFNLPDDQPAERVIEELTLRLGRWLQIKHIDEATTAGREEMIRGALEAKPHLVFIDGVEAPTHTDALNARLNGIVGRSKFLVTARTVPTPINQTFVYDLDEIGVKESQRLLKAQTEATNGISAEAFTDEVVQRIHHSIGGHPLTLILFPHLLKQHSLDSLLQAIELGVEGKHTFIYQRVWDMLSADAQRLIMGLCFFGGLGASESALQETCSLGRAELYQSIREMSQFGLLQTRGGLEEKVYNLHNLTIQYVQILVRGAADPQDFINATKRVFSHWLTVFKDSQITLPYELVLQLQQTLRISQIIQNNADISQLRCELLYTVFTPFKDNGFLSISEAFWDFSLSYDVSGDQLYQARLTNQLAFIKLKNQEFNSAQNFFQKALELGLQEEDTLEIARSHHHLSWCYYGAKEFKHAEKHNAEALRLFKEFDIHNEDHAKARLRRGILQSDQQKFDDAKQTFLETINYLEETNQPQYVAQVYQNLGLLFDATQSYDQALSAYRKAQHFLLEFPNKLRQIKLKLAEGSLHLDFGEPRKAIDILQKIDHAFLDDIQDFHILNSIRHNIALSLINLNQLKEAEELIPRLIAYRRKHEQTYDALLLLEMQADIYMREGREHKGVATLKQVLGEARQLPPEAKVIKLMDRVEKLIGDSGFA